MKAIKVIMTFLTILCVCIALFGIVCMDSEDLTIPVLMTVGGGIGAFLSYFLFWRNVYTYESDMD